jgi:hypothetical protein
MSVLNARRRASNRLRTATNDDECERQCQANNSNETCRMKCSRELKLMRYASNSNNATALPAIQHESSTVDSNIIVHSNDEFLDTEESVHGLYFTNPNNSNSTNNDNKTKAKESSNLITSNGSVKKEIKDSKTLPLLPTVSASESTTSTTLKQILNRRNKNLNLRTSLSPSEARSTMYRGRVRYSPSNFGPLEEAEDPYLTGQRLVSTTSRNPDVKRQLGGSIRRRPQQYQSTTPSRSKEEELEIMEVSVAKQSSTEKTKFWKSRNLVAINNYMRRLSPTLSSSSSTTVTRPPLQVSESGSNSSTSSPSSPLSTTKANKILTTLQYKTINKRPQTPRVEEVEEGQMVTSIAAVNNLAEENDDDDDEVKNIFVRNIEHVRENDGNATESRVEGVKHSLPSLIINVPDDATPIFFNDERRYQQSDGEIETERVEILTTTTNSIELSTLLPVQNTISSSTTTSVVKSSTESPTIIIPKSTKRIYTTIPRRKLTTTVLPFSNKTTLSTFLKNVATRTQSTFGSSSTSTSSPKTESTSVTYRSISRATSEVTSTSSTLLDISKTLKPVEFEIAVAPPSVTPDSTILTSTTNVFIQGIPATSLKPNENEVLIEMQNFNLATLLMGALGLLPLVVILVYVIRQYLYKNEMKDSSDIGNYGNDIQPISPVVILDQSDDGGSIDGADSYISIAEFDRSNLRFQSLLGEGNFGQVWKADADNLPGYVGTTRIVAVKTERVNNGQGGLKAECEIMRKLGSHSNVVTLLSACIEQGELNIILLSTYCT